MSKNIFCKGYGDFFRIFIFFEHNIAMTEKLPRNVHLLKNA